MRQNPGFLYMTGFVVILLAALCLGWTAAFYTTNAIYARVGWQPSELVGLLANAMLGCLLFGTGMAVVGPLIQRNQRQFLSEMIDALKRVSRGDFHVYLDLGFGGRRGKHQNNPFVKLVDSINDMAVHLKAMEEMRQEFVSNVSHEIGTPLTSIGGFAKALRDEKLPPELRQRYLTIIETECARLSKLSDNLLKLAALDSDRHPFHPAAYRLDRQLTSLILACEPQWEAKQLEMVVELEETELIADEDLMSHVWMNVLANAIKFTPEGGHIRVRLERREDRAIVSVADTGIGIAEGDRERIFERFYKTDKSRTRSAGGSGLGLSIARKIVDMHSGSISVSSKPGEGAQFQVSLPLRGLESDARQPL